MNYNVTFKKPMVGFSTGSYENGEEAKIVKKAFLSDSSGSFFYKLLESIYNGFLKQSDVKQSKIEHFLILIDDEENIAKTYINELDFIGKAIPKKEVKKGDDIHKKDLAGITKLEIKDVDIPSNNGIIIFFQVGWKRALYFNLLPVESDNQLMNVEEELADIYEYLLFSELFDLEVIEKGYELGWFPFISIIGDRYENILNRLSENKDIEDTEKRIIDSVKENELDNMLKRWENSNLLNEHIEILEKGIERYKNDDFIASISCVWTRIEGVLRSFYESEEYPTQQKLSENIEALIENIAPSTYLPSQFKDYLKSYYFNNFNVEKGELQLSRNSISHGVAQIKDFDKKRALTGLLIIDQLVYYHKLYVSTS